MCVDGDTGIRKLEKLSHARVPENDSLSVIGKTIGEAYQAVTSTAGIVCSVLRSMERGFKAGVYNEIRIVFFMQCVDLFVIP